MRDSGDTRHAGTTANNQVVLNLFQAAEHLDDDDVVEEETALENFTTSVDNEEIDEFIAFRTSLQGTLT